MVAPSWTSRPQCLHQLTTSQAWKQGLTIECSICKAIRDVHRHLQGHGPVETENFYDTFMWGSESNPKQFHAVKKVEGSWPHGTSTSIDCWWNMSRYSGSAFCRDVLSARICKSQACSKKCQRITNKNTSELPMKDHSIFILLDFKLELGWEECSQHISSWLLRLPREICGHDIPNMYVRIM